MQNPYQYIFQIKSCTGTPVQRSLQNALIGLLQDRNHSEITVKELCQHAFVARSSFYAYYQNTDGILEEIEDSLIYTLLHQNSEIMDRGVNTKEKLRFYAQTMDFVEENKVVFYTLLIDSPNHRFMEKWKSAIKYHFWERLFRNEEAKNSGLILEMVSSVVISAYTYWLKHPYEVDLEGIYLIIADILKMLDYED